MSKEKKKIGYNPANINPIEDQAIKLIKEVYENLLDLKQHIKKSCLGKNKTLRDNGAVMSNIMSNKLIKRLEPWHKIIEANDNGADIHSAPLKHHKLEIVANSHYEKFGQYLVDEPVGSTLWTDEYGDAYPTKEKFLEAIGDADEEK